MHILKLMRNLTGSHCNRFRIGKEQLTRGGLGYHSCKAVMNALLSWDIFFWHIFEKVSRNNLTCYWPVPLQFAWKDLRQLFSNSTQVTDMIEVCPTCLGSTVHVFFLDMSFRKSGLLSNTKPRCLADADGFVSWPGIKHEELFRIFLAEVWSQWEESLSY